MANIVECTGPTFRGLVNPYTNEEIKVKMLIPPNGTPMYFADTYTPARRMPTAKEAYAAWSRVGGVENLKPGKAVRCAYTGKIMNPESDEFGHWFSGGFDPTKFHTHDEFLYYVTMRDGVASRPAPEARDIPVKPVAEEAPMARTHEAKYIDGALETAELAMKKANFKAARKTRVRGGIDNG